MDHASNDIFPPHYTLNEKCAHVRLAISNIAIAGYEHINLWPEKCSGQAVNNR